VTPRRASGGGDRAWRSRDLILDARCPAVTGLPDDIYHVLQHSFVDIVKMRRRIESGDALIDTSRKAVIEAFDVLKRMREAGF